jgi:glycosyltransferase involved in cell wall biosynthesis
MKSKKSILFIIPQLKIGGTERHFLKLVNNLSKFHNITIVCFSKHGSDNLSFHNEINDRIYLKFFDLKFPYINFFISLIHLKFNSKFDFIHSYNYNDVKWDFFIKMFFFKAILITERRNIQHWRSSKSIAIFEKLRNKYTDFIVANSYSCKEVAIRIEGLQEKKIKIIYNSINNPNIDFVSKSNSFKIISLANIKSIKNQLEIILAFEKINIPNKELYLIGKEDGIYSQELRNYVNKRGIKNIFFVGLVESTRSYLQKADLLVSTSKAEGFSNSILEALSFGIPVIASNVGGNVEVIKNEFNGYIYQLGNVEDLLTKIHLLYDKIKIGQSFKTNCQKVIDDFSEEKMINKYLHLYE